MLYCKAPSSDTVVAGMPFRISLNDEQTAPGFFAYYYYPRPDIWKLIPDRGPLSGGNEVLILGNDLDPFNNVLDIVNNHQDTLCRFGPNYYVKAKIYSDTKISCIAPASTSVKTVLIDITLNGADEQLNA
jgi:hypothetical protein